MSTTAAFSSVPWGETDVEWTATAIGAAVRAGHLHPSQVTEEALRRIGERDGALNAFAHVRDASARSEAAALAQHPELAQLPLAGVPVAVKESVQIAGGPALDGTPAAAGQRFSADHSVVGQLRSAGAIIVGTTRIPQFSLYSATDRPGVITRNPWNPHLTAGGSSGGAAAAVASGMVPLAHGTDALGGVRIPAAACGLVGMKPGAGLVPRDLGGADWFGMLEHGVLASTVADAALGMSVLAQDAALADTTLPNARLVIAVSQKSPVAGVRVDDAYQRALSSAATLLARAGNEVRSADPDYSTRASLSVVARWFAVADQAMRSTADPTAIERRVRAQARLGSVIGRTPLVKDTPARAFIEAAQQFLSAYDLLVTPALAQPPIPAREWSNGSLLRTLRGTVPWTPFAAPWNQVGFPTIVVPTGTLHPRTRTPLAVQIVARRGREQLLLAIAAQLESVRPWSLVAPAYAGQPDHTH
ncbi:MAG: amidase [Candidatus Nanopelagicales bacterium]